MKTSAEDGRRLRVAMGWWLTAVVLASGAAEARSLRAAMEEVAPFPILVDDFQGLARIFGRTVTEAVPLISSSTAFTYEFDPKLDLFQRRRITLGPLLSQRAETLGRGRFDLGVGFAYADFTAIDDVDLDSLVGNFIFLSPGGPQPAQVRIDMDLEAQAYAFGLAYGLTEDMDVDVTVPVIRTFVRARSQVASGGGVIGQAAVTEAQTGIGDVAVRLKHMIVRDPGGNSAAASLSLRVPSGSEDDFHGTGDTELGGRLIVSRVFGETWEPYLNVGADAVLDDIRRSRLHYAGGLAVAALAAWTLDVGFIGRTEFSEPITLATPMFVAPERGDRFDLSVGTKVGLGESVVLSFAALIPLNDDGLRADFIPSGAVEVFF